MKNTFGRIMSVILVVAICLSLTSCGDGYKKIDNATFGDIRTEFNEDFKVGELNLNKGILSDDFEEIYEAEEAILTGGATVISKSEFSGEKGVGGVNGQNDSLTFHIDLADPGFYSLTFASYSDDIGRTNNVLIDGQNGGFLGSNVAGAVEEIMLDYIYLEAGEHDVSVVPSWGWVQYDYLKIAASKVDIDKVYDVTPKLCNPNADERTVRLYNFLCDIFGKYTLTGQGSNEGRLSKEYLAILDVTGKEHAVLDLEVAGYTSTSIAHGGSSDAVEVAYDWYINKGGIVTMQWHWHSPDEYVPEGKAWYSSFNTEHSSIDLDKAMNGEDDVLLESIKKDIDLMSEQFARLRDAGVPIIWRPLHEAAGGWFWWGDCEPESFIKLWRLIYDKMTNEHNLTNIIWMWNGQGEEWYPGDDVVDIVAWDMYPGEHEHSSQAATFIRCAKIPGESKLIAESECGTIPDPELMQRDNARWLFYATWGGDFVIRFDDAVYNPQYTDIEMIRKIYDSEYTLTLDELPDLKNYRLD